MAKKSGFWAEFKHFIARGNVVDMAVGVVVGAAFTAIVNSLVKNIINPLVGLLTGGIDFGDLKIVLKPATETTAELAITYGVFINSIVNFLIIALVVFIMVRALNNFKAKLEQKKKAEEETIKAEAPQKAKDPQIVLLEEIRDLLKEQKSCGN